VEAKRYTIGELAGATEVIASSRTRYLDAYECVTGLRFADWPGVSGTP
jgi:hypothetical protein